MVLVLSALQCVSVVFKRKLKHIILYALLNV